MQERCINCVNWEVSTDDQPCFDCCTITKVNNFQPKEKTMSKPTNITCPTESQIIDGYKVSPELMEKLFPEVIKEHLEKEKEKDRYFDLGNPGKFIYSTDCKTTPNVEIFVANSCKYQGNAFFLSGLGINWKLEREDRCLYLIPTKKQ